MSNDHKPNRKDEYKRILSKGGKIEKLTSYNKLKINEKKYLLNL